MTGSIAASLPEPPATQTGRDLRWSGLDYLAGAAGTYAAMGLSVALTWVLTRSLGVAGYGRVALMLTTGLTIAYFTTFWTTAGLWRYGSEARLEGPAFRRMFWGRNMFLLPGAVLVAGALWQFRGPLHRQLEIPPAAWWAVGAYTLAVIVFHTSQFTFQALRRQREFVRWQVAEKLALLALVAALGGAVAARPWLAVWMYAATCGAAGICAFLMLERSHWHPVETDRETLRKFWKFSWPFTVSLVFGYLSTNWIDLLIIRRYWGMADVGSYQLAYQIMGFVQTLPMASFPVTLPLLVSWQVAGHQSGVELYASRLVPHACVALAAALVGALVVLRPVILTVFGAEFAPAVTACGWLLVGVGCYGVFISGLPLLNLWERTTVILWASIAGGSVNIIGNLLLVPRWGIQGAAIATLLSHAVAAAVVLADVRARVTVPLRPVVLSLAAVAAVFAGFVLAPGPAGYAAGAGLAAALLAGAIGTGRLFGRDEWRWLWAVMLRDPAAAAKAAS